MDEKTYYAVSIALTAFASLTALVGLVFACIQLFQIKRNRKQQYDQARRDKTVEMVVHYNKSVNVGTKATERIVANFSDDQCQDLYNFVPFAIDEKTKEQLCKFCPEKNRCNQLKKKDLKPCQDENGNYVVKESILHFLRGNIISYLNTLESVLLSWQLGIVDQKVIEEQFLFLDKKRQRERALEIFRNIAGNGHSYPAIEKFYQHLDKKKQEDAEKSLKSILK